MIPYLFFFFWPPLSTCFPFSFTRFFLYCTYPCITIVIALYTTSVTAIIVVIVIGTARSMGWIEEMGLLLNYERHALALSFWVLLC